MKVDDRRGLYNVVNSFNKPASAHSPKSLSTKELNLASKPDPILEETNSANETIGALEVANKVLKNLELNANSINNLRSKDAIDDMKKSMQEAINSASYNANKLFGSYLSFKSMDGDIGMVLNAPSVNSLDFTKQSQANFRKSLDDMRAKISSMQKEILNKLNSSIDGLSGPFTQVKSLSGYDLASAHNLQRLGVDKLLG